MGNVQGSTARFLVEQASTNETRVYDPKNSKVVWVSKYAGLIIAGLVTGLALHFGTDLSGGYVFGASLIGGGLGYGIGKAVGNCIHYVRNGRPEDLEES